MRILGYIHFGLCFILLSTTKGADLKYVITPDLNSFLPQIKVEIEVETDVNGEAHLLYYNTAWGEGNLFNALASIRSLSEGSKAYRLPEKDLVLVKGPASKKVKIEYIIRQDFSGEATSKQYYRPIINNKYFHLFGHRLFLIPQDRFASHEKQEIEIIWNKKGHFVRDNFGDAQNGVYELSQSELLESVLVGGDFREKSIKVDGIKLRLLTRGIWENFKDEELLDKIKTIVEVQRSFWNDYSDELYTVTLLPLESNYGREIGGTGLAKGFASYCSKTARPKIENLTALYYHEIMHHWIGGKIRNASLSEELWFSEGFTEYFSQILMLQEGEISKLDFRKALVNAQKALRNSSSRGVKNSKLSLNSDYEKIPYLRGMLYANYLDSMMQEAEKGQLKAFMHRILSESESINFSNTYFKALLLEILGPSEVIAFEDYIIDGKEMPTHLPYF